MHTSWHTCSEAGPELVVPYPFNPISVHTYIQGEQHKAMLSAISAREGSNKMRQCGIQRGGLLRIIVMNWPSFIHDGDETIDSCFCRAARKG